VLFGISETYTYWALDLICLSGPLLLSFDRKVAYYKKWGVWLLATLPVSLFYLLWDIAFTEIGVWSFNPTYLMGFEWYKLPLEEYLFFLVVPYASVFIYECLIQYFPATTENKDGDAAIWFVMAAAAGLVSFWNFLNLYTSITFALLAICLVALRYSRVSIRAFFFSWGICLIPMALMNGVLTALPVVIYNNNENLAIRLGSIPIEDFFYHMLYLGAILGLYERQLKRY